jgi:methyltransferase
MIDPPRLILTGALALVLVQRLVELRIARCNHRALLEAGATEHGAGHYPFFFLLHGGWLAAWPLEAWLLTPGGLHGLWPLWAGLLVVAEILRYWTLATLGDRWTTRILVLPGESPVTRGPFRYFKHPNYLAVALELACWPLMFSAWRTAVAFTILNVVLILGVRIPAEREAWRSLRSES